MRGFIEMLVNTTLYGVEYSVLGSYEPAEGDGWNEPHYSECFEIYEVRDAHGKKITNWKDYWTPADVENSVLMELAYLRRQSESDDPYNE
jgi:hypothetical protein